MRELKFRTWSKTMHSMSPSHTLNQLITAFVKHGWEMDGTLTLLQHTGLKDKNGVEIYEGDILADDIGVLGNKLEEPMTATVIWKDRYWSTDHSSSGMAFAGKAPFMTWNECEVIGNIYENPELLK